MNKSDIVEPEIIYRGIGSKSRALYLCYTSARDIRGSDNRTSELVKRGGFLGSHGRTLAWISFKVSCNILLML